MAKVKRYGDNFPLEVDQWDAFDDEWRLLYTGLGGLKMQKKKHEGWIDVESFHLIDQIRIGMIRAWQK